MHSEQDEGPQIQNTVEGQVPNASRRPDGKVILVVHDGLPWDTAATLQQSCMGFSFRVYTLLESTLARIPYKPEDSPMI